ncbi:MAG TPA: ABC transporter permease, partial [Gemmatimonadales bacterium]|nr:ABC transporter permease [Gemmatimonadales bacterium]
CNQAGNCDKVWSYPMFRDLEQGQKTLTGIAAHRTFGANLGVPGQTPTNGDAVFVSGSYFPVLQLAPALGRLIGPADDRAVGESPVAVLSYQYWESQLGASPAVLNQTIIINGQSLTIIGVAPQGFTGTTLGNEPRVFVPITMRPALIPQWTGIERRTSYWVYLFGRLKPGVSVAQASADLNTVYHPIITDVEAPLQKGMSDKTMVRFKDKKVVVEEGSRGQSSIHSQSRTPLLFLLGITGVVLLIACANIANLLLARGASRAGEMAVRLSLGATRGRVVRQLLVEACVLAVLGGLASLLVARWTLAGIGAILPPDAIQTLRLDIEWPVMLFTGALSLGAGILFGIFPALHSTRPDLITTIRSNVGQIAGGRAANRFRSSLVVAQIALATALLIAAGFFIRSLINVSRVDLGLNTDHVVTFGISPELNGYQPARSAVLFQQLEDELASTPGVTGVSTSMVPLLAGSNWGNDVSVEGFKKGPDTDANSRFNEVGPDYFKTMQVPLLSGREFTRADGLGSAKVAVVNETFAKKFHLGRDAVGKHMSLGSGPLDIEIVGLARDAKYAQVKDPAPPLFFIPYLQDSTIGSNNYYVRTTLNPVEFLRTVPKLVANLDPNLPVENLKTLPEQVKENVFLDRMITTLSAAFAVLATILAAVGLYGVLAYTVALRTREFGVRMALGADAGRVRGMVVRQVALMTLIGGVIGVAAAVGLGRGVQSLLYGMQATDPVVIVLATTLLSVVALGAGFLPALRASRVHPMQALRYE